MAWVDIFKKGENKNNDNPKPKVPTPHKKKVGRPIMPSKHDKGDILPAPTTAPDWTTKIGDSMLDFKARKEKKKADEAAKLAQWKAKERGEQRAFVIAQEEFMRKNPNHFYRESQKRKHVKKLRGLRKKWFGDDDGESAGSGLGPISEAEEAEGGEESPPDLVPSMRTNERPTHVSARDARNSARSEGKLSRASGSAEGSGRDAYAAQGQSQRSSQREASEQQKSSNKPTREASRQKSSVKPTPPGFLGSVSPSNAEEQNKIRQDSKDSAKRRDGSQQSQPSRDTTQTQRTADYNLGNMARTHVEGMAPGNPTAYRPTSKLRTTTVKGSRATKKTTATAANKMGDMKRTIIEGQVPKSQLPTNLKSATVVSKSENQGKLTYTSPKDEQGNLPHGWQENKDGKGRTFYQNFITRETSWKPPSS